MGGVLSRSGRVDPKDREQRSRSHGDGLPSQQGKRRNSGGGGGGHRSGGRDSKGEEGRSQHVKHGGSGQRPRGGSARDLRAEERDEKDKRRSKQKGQEGTPFTSQSEDNIGLTSASKAHVTPSVKNKMRAHMISEGMTENYLVGLSIVEEEANSPARTLGASSDGPSHAVSPKTPQHPSPSALVKPSFLRDSSTDHPAHPAQGQAARSGSAPAPKSPLSSKGLGIEVPHPGMGAVGGAKMESPMAVTAGAGDAVGQRMMDGTWSPDDEEEEMLDLSNLASSDPANTEMRTIGNIVRWQRGNLVGKGSYGKVYSAMNTDTGELFVVKQVVFTASAGSTSGIDEEVLQLEQEIALLGSLAHNHIVKYLGTERNFLSNELSIFLEHMPGGSIADIVAKFGRLQEAVIKKYTREVLSGLNYLHGKGIIHRDIKGQNILVDNRGVCKLADFGASRYLQNAESVANMSFKGTPVFMSPEVIMEQRYSRKSDVWSVGCTVLQMATGNPPFSEFSNHIAALFHITSTTEPPSVPDSLTQDARDFVLLCFDRDVKTRPFVDALQNHVFVEKTNEPATPNSDQVRVFGSESASPSSGRLGLGRTPNSPPVSPSKKSSTDRAKSSSGDGPYRKLSSEFPHTKSSRGLGHLDPDQDDDARYEAFKKGVMKEHRVTARIRKASHGPNRSMALRNAASVNFDIVSDNHPSIPPVERLMSG